MVILKNRKKIKLKDLDKILILHHWDCDGLCSAAMMNNYLKEINKCINIEFFLPEIGHYFLDEADFLKIKEHEPDIIFIVDMALQKKDVLKLHSLTKDLFIFDHHKQSEITEVNHFNPLADTGISSLDYPSTGWVINDFFEKEQNLLSVLGAIGDQEERVKSNKVIQQILQEEGLQYSNCVYTVKTIDSCYIVNDREMIHWMIGVLIEGDKNLALIQKNPRILENTGIINEEINREIGKALAKDEKRKIIFKELDSEFHIISDISRRLSAGFPEYLVIVINRNKSALSNIYFRTGDLDADLTPVLGWAKKNDYNAGGKKEVVGIFCPETDVDNLIKNVLDILGK